MHLGKLVHRVGFPIFAIDHQVFLPLPQHVLGLLHGVLEVVQDGVQLLHRGHHLGEVIVDLVRVPVERGDGLLQHLLDLFDLLRNQRALHGEQRSENVVESSDDEVEVTRLLTQRLVPFVNLMRGRRDVSVQEHEVLGLA